MMIYCYLDAAEFEGVFIYYLVRNSFINQRINIKISKDDFTISDYLYQNFEMLIGKSTTCISCNQNKHPKILKYDSFILLLEGIASNNNKMMPIYHDKMTHLAYHCVTTNELMDTFYENTELSDVIC